MSGINNILFSFWDPFNEVMSYQQKMGPNELKMFWIRFTETVKGENNPVLRMSLPWPDSEGNTVFTGDIIETVYKDDMEETGEGRVRNLVDFVDGAFCYKGENSGKWEPLIEFDLQESRVIGNQFQNPELLEAS